MKTRDEVALEDQWDLKGMYENLEAWKSDFKNFNESYSCLVREKETFLQSEKNLRSFLDRFFECDKHISKLYTFAHLKHDVDLGDTESKKLYETAFKGYLDFREQFSWIEPAILSLSSELLKRYISSADLEKYKVFLERLIRLKVHVLSENEEHLLALAATPLEAVSKAFNTFNNVDVRFAKIKDEEGKEVSLSHGNYIVCMRSQDRILREEAFKAMHTEYGKMENTLSELLVGHVQKHVFEAKARKYSSCLEAALFPHAISPDVYRSLIQTVRQNLPVLHRYMALRKKAMGLETLHLYDLYVPLVKDLKFEMRYEEAAEKIINSVGVLGKEYQTALKSGLTDQRWVDRFENKGKRSGAYSGGCFSSHPYILMNFSHSFNDMKTLAHEAGHSMHSWLSRKNQPYIHSDYSIFVAEVASTFNEELLLHFLLGEKITKEQRIYILNQKIDDIRTTLFRQAMFAEFELFVHETVEKGIPLTLALLKEHYYALNKDYFGKEVEVDLEVMVEPLRIPHFYSNFYVYQYATGISAALTLAHEVLKDKEGSKQNYLRFLSSGSTLDPLDALKLAGVDMCSPHPVQEAINHFGVLIEEMEKLLR